MALQPTVHVVNGKVQGAYASQAKNIEYKNSQSVEDALDGLQMIVENVSLPAKTIPANNTDSYSVDISKNNYTPIAIIGFHGNNSYIALTNCYIDYSTVKATISVRNYLSAPYSGLKSIDVLYKAN